MENVLKCTKCQKQYSTKGNLRRHLEETHENVVCRKYKNPENFTYNCKCGKNFNNKHNFLYHLKLHQPTTEASNSDHNQIIDSKKCPMCPYTDKYINNLIEHFQQRHDYVIKTQTLEFFSRDTFNTWKSETEKNTNSSFVKQYTKSYLKGITTFFLCNRSGNYVEKKSKRLRSLKTRGTNKINAFCPASIKVLVDSDEKCTVKYIETHIGHVNDLGHLFLNPLDRSQIASKIALRVPFDTILDDIHDSVTNSTLYRIHLLTKKDLHNIKNSFSLHSDSIRHSNDCVSVEAWINEFKNKDDIQEREIDMSQEKEHIKVDFLQILEEAKTLPELKVLKKKVASLRPTLTAVRTAGKIKSVKSSEVPRTPHNKNITSQRKFFTTQKKKKRNAEKLIARPATSKRQQLAINLLNKN